MSARLTAKFGDLVENGWASADNPTRVGYFVREFRRTGRLNPGLTWELTDGKGAFWEVKPVATSLGEHKLTVTPASPFVRTTDEVVSYVMRYGGMCRGCADENGICPSVGLPCESAPARKAVRHVIEAVNYGLRHGYLPRAATTPRPATDTDGSAAGPVTRSGMPSENGGAA